MFTRLLSILFLLALCSIATPGYGQTSGGSCPVVIAAAPSGGCRITLLTGTDCQVLRPSAAGYYELAWSTGGTFCEGPVKILITGNPASSWLYGNNYLLYTLSSGNSNWSWMDRNIGGYIHLLPSDLAKLATDNGQLNWGLQSFYGSSSGSGTFTLQTAGNPQPVAASDSDRIFNWAESTFTQFFVPKGVASQSISGYYLRYYAQTNVYLATAGSNLYIYAPQLIGPTPADLGAISLWLAEAKKAGY